MKIKLLLLSLLITSPVFSQLKGGLIVGAGQGSIRYQLKENSIYQQILENGGLGSIDYKNNYLIGYKLRYKINPDFFYDFDLNMGLHNWKVHYYGDYNSSTGWTGGESRISSNSFSASVSATVNYMFNNRLYAGAGLSPVYYFDEYLNLIKPAIDIPLVGKIGYNLKCIDVAFSYRYGLCNVFKTENINNLKFNEWQISLFIPF